MASEVVTSASANWASVSVPNDKSSDLRVLANWSKPENTATVLMVRTGPRVVQHVAGHDWRLAKPQQLLKLHPSFSVWQTIAEPTTPIEMDVVTSIIDLKSWSAVVWMTPLAKAES